MTDIARLIADLEAAKHSSFEMECRLAEMLEPERLAGGMHPANYTTSVDVVRALSTRLYPEREWSVSKSGIARLYHPENRMLDTQASCINPAIALSVAILKAQQREWTR